jgi:phospholipid/cholesterol/gamma-HCH transport system substrate-binding protein
MKQRHIVLAVVAALLVGGIALAAGMREKQRHLSAVFPRTTSLYEGAAVKVLGVKVGRVDKIRVEGTAVRVDMSYNEQVSLPRGVTAVIVPPSIVGDRFIQLSPAYTGGQKLAEGARLGLDRTGVPLELEDTYSGLNKLAASLGPKGNDRTGAFSRLIGASARNLKGNGELWNSTLTDFAAAMSTLAASGEDFNSTLANLGVTTRMLKGKDADVRELVDAMADVGGNLNDQGNDLAVAMKDLRTALKLVARFTKDNRGEIDQTVNELTSLTGQLSKHRADLDKELSVAPLGMNDTLRSYVATNWDVAHPEDVAPGARTGSTNNRTLLTTDLNTTLGYALSTICHSLPPEQRVQMQAFCTALEGVGGDFGALLEQLTAGPVSSAADSNSGAKSLSDLTSGGR